MKDLPFPSALPLDEILPMTEKIFPRLRQLGVFNLVAMWNSQLSLLACLVSFVAMSANASNAREPLASKAETERRSAAEILPASVVAYVEMASPTRLVEYILKHPLRGRVEALPAIADALKSDGFTQFRSAVSVFEAGMGMRWPKVVAALSHGGVYAAFDAKHQGGIALLQAENEEVLVQFRDTVFSAVRAGRPAGAKGDPIQRSEFRGVTKYTVGGDVELAFHQRWLIVANKSASLDWVLGQLLDPASESLADQNEFQQAHAMANSNALAWGMVDVGAIRDAGVAKRLYSGKTDNVLVEMLLGGIVSTLQHTPFVTAELFARDETIDLRLTSQLDTSWAGEDRAYYFGADGLAEAPEMPDLENRVFALSAYRDLSDMWLRAGDLMTEKANDQLAQADTQLTTFFSGKDFGEDILGSFGPEVQLLVARQEFDAFPQPAIRLPAFALKMNMNEPEKTRPELRRVFQSFIGFLNITGAMQGQPQFDLGMQQTDAVQLVTANYVVNEELQDATDAPINFNFSPTLAFAGTTFVLASTTDLALRIVESPEPEQQSLSGHNSIAALDAATLHSILSDNFEQLIAQNMLEKGHDRSLAEAEIGTLLDLIRLFDGADLTLDANHETLGVNLILQLTSSAVENGSQQESVLGKAPSHD